VLRFVQGVRTVVPMLRVATVVVCLTVCVASPAEAAPSHSSWFDRAVAVADAHWPLSPCHGRVSVVSATDEQIVAWTGEASAGAGASVDGSCRVFVAWDLWSARPVRQRCRLLEHEFGHLAGVDHSLNPASVMFPVILDLGRGSTDCVRAFPERRAWPMFDTLPDWRALALDRLTL
jgi:hypothetical protein